MTALIHPPGSLPDAAPKGLVDLWIARPATPAEQAQVALQSLWQQHSGPLILAGLLAGLLIILGFWLARDWRGRVLRFQLKRLSRLIARAPEVAPQSVGPALMWALARYFHMRPAVNRAALPQPWQNLIAELDRLRFGLGASPQAWQQLLEKLAMQTRCVPRTAIPHNAGDS
jgi:hypothetical protein